MSWLWKAKALLYDPTIRRVGPLHRLVRRLAWRVSRVLMAAGSAITRFEVPLHPGVAPYFRFSWVTGRYEKEIVTLYSRMLRPGMTVVDVGAHVGYHTIRFAKLVGPTGKVFAFEPHPSNFEILCRNVRRRGLANVIMEQKAVSNVNGQITLYLGPHDLRHSLVPQGSEACEVNCVCLDSYFDANEVVHLVKIDVEGAELGVLRGMRSLMDRSSKLIIILEFYPALLRAFGGETAPVDLLKLLCDSGFHLLNDHMVPLEKYKSLELFVSSVPKLTNLLAIKKPWN